MIAETEGTLIDTRWLDINKGDESSPEYRSRLCGREFKFADPMMEGCFSSTPPLDCLKFQLSSALMSDEYEKVKHKYIMVIDVSRAYLHATTGRNLFIELPVEDATPGVVGRLLKCLYGTRDAGARWEKCWQDALIEFGYKIGSFNSCLAYNPDTGVSLFGHGDDFVAVGGRKEVLDLHEKLKGVFLLKLRALLGPDDDCQKSVTVLNRMIRWIDTSDGPKIEYEADSRHADIALHQLGMDKANAKGSVVTGAKSSNNDDRVLPVDKCKLFRSITMRVNYFVGDRLDLQYVAKECARSMSSPTYGAVEKLKKLLRYLVSHRRVVQTFVPQTKVKRFSVATDSDHAGCLTTRKSTSGIFLFHGKNLIRSSSTTQGSVTLSSGESEFHALVKGASVVLGARAMAKDLGHSLDASHLSCDATAGLGISKRTGVGRIRHLHTPLLWVQERIRNKELLISKAPGKENVVDMGTKYLPGTETAHWMQYLNFEFRRGVGDMKQVVIHSVLCGSLIANCGR